MNQKVNEYAGRKQLDLASLSQEELAQFRARNQWRFAI
jgi:hypothetical protein